MITYQEVVGGILDYVRYPDPASLSLGSILHRLQDKLTYYLSQLNLAPNTNWLLKTTEVITVPSLSIYPVITEGWGRPINVEVIDHTNPRLIRRDIPIVDYQDLDLTSSGGMRSDSEGVSFTTVDGQPEMHVSPIPSAALTYLITYKPTTLPPPRLTSSFQLLENFVALVKVDTAIACLPDCQWTGVELKEASQRRNDISTVLMLDFERYLAQFEEWRRSERQEQVTRKRGWGDDYEPYELEF